MLENKLCLNQDEQLFDIPFKDVSVTYYFKQVLEQVNKQNIKRNFAQHFNLVAIYISKPGSKKTDCIALAVDVHKLRGWEGGQESFHNDR